MEKESRICGIILASGFSRRMGEQKLLLPFNNKSILENSISNIKKSKLSWQDIYVVVPNYDKERINIVTNHHLGTVMNKEAELGMGYSLAKGIRAVQHKADAVMVMLADQPEIKPDDINLVYDEFLKRFHSEGKTPPMIIQTNYQDQHKGHPILFSSHFFNELSKLDRDFGGRRILKNYHQYVSIVASANSYPSDIDTPTDYNRLLARHR